MRGGKRGERERGKMVTVGERKDSGVEEKSSGEKREMWCILRGEVVEGERKERKNGVC